MNPFVSVISLSLVTLAPPPLSFLLSAPVPFCAPLLSLSSSLSCPLNLFLALSAALSLSRPLRVCNGCCHPGGFDEGRGQEGEVPWGSESTRILLFQQQTGCAAVISCYKLIFSFYFWQPRTLMAFRCLNINSQATFVDNLFSSLR